MGDYWSRAHICQCLTRILTICPVSTITITGHRRKTGQQFVASVLGLAHHLSHLGLLPGDIVAICALSSDWYLEWLLAVTYVGGIVAPLNYRWSFDEAKLALEVIRPVMIVTDDCCTWLLELQDSQVISPRWHVSVNFYSSTADSMKKVPERCQPLSINYCWSPEDVAIICFTSGTTGKPKGVTISHTALMLQSLAKIAIVGYTEDDVYMHTAPLCHIGGISSCMAMLMAGGCHVLTAKFDSKMAAEAIKEYHVTSLITVPTILSDLISATREKYSRKQVPTINKILNGGGSLSVQMIEDAVRCFPRAKLLSAYGMTETCSSITFITLYDPVSKNLNQHLEKIEKTLLYSASSELGICVGKPAPHVEISIAREDSSPTGRIMTRGPHVMLRYWGQMAAAGPECAEHWFDTGDIGRIDTVGNLWLVGRRNGRIKSGGENVYPEEVESILSQHPGISSVVVIGLPHKRLGEMVVACIQVKDKWTWLDCNGDSSCKIKMCLSNEMLKEYCWQRRLTRFKIPKAFIAWRKPFPLTSTGKIRRDQVKGEASHRLNPLLSNI